MASPRPSPMTYLSIVRANLVMLATLGLPSLNVLLYMWQVVRNHQPRSASGATDITNATTLAQTHLHASDVPTLMRYASEVALEVAMQARPGYTEVSLPDSLRARSRGVAVRPRVHVLDARCAQLSPCARNARELQADDPRQRVAVRTASEHV